MDLFALLRMGLKGETMDDEVFTVNGSGTKKAEVWNELFKQVQRQPRRA